jgi:uncharacterized membrane protein
MSPNVHGLERVATAAAAAWLLTSYSRGQWKNWGGAARAIPWVAGALAFRALTGYCGIYGALGTGTRRTDTRTRLAGRRGIHVRERTTVARRPYEVFSLWRRLDNLPDFMPHLESVEELDERRSHWITRPIAGMRFEWDAEIIDEIEGEHIGWRSLPGSDIVSAGSVHFKPTPDGRGTDVEVVLQYDPPAGHIGGAIAALLGDDPASQFRQDLHRFKQWLEAGAPAAHDTALSNGRQGGPRGLDTESFEHTALEAQARRSDVG